MNQEKIGRFIAHIRTEKKLTQQELANKLNVTDRAISNWENGRRMPDVSFYKPLCEIFDITVNELMNGEKIATDDLIKASDEAIINTITKNKKDKKKSKIIASFFVMIILILLIIIFITLKNRFPKINIYKLYFGHLDPGFVLEEQFSYDNRTIYYYGVDAVQVCNKQDNCVALESALINKQITINDIKSYYDEQFTLNNNQKSVMYDGGTSVYNNKGYTIMFCNTIDDNKDIYIGSEDMIEKLNGNYCGKEEYPFKYFIRTYKILESILDKNDSEFVNIIVENNKGEKDKVKVNYTNNLVVGKTYEFTFYAYGKFSDNIKNIFEKSTLMSISETDNLPWEQINDKIYFNEEFDTEVELNDLDHVSMEIESSSLTNTSAKIKILDFSGHKYIYGSSYRLDKKENGKWIELSIICKNCAWNSMAYWPDKNNTLIFNVNWEKLYGKLTSGTYRIVKDVLLNSNKSFNEEDRLYISAEFTIE